MASITSVQRSAGTKGGIAEIGVHHGRFFIGLHLTRRPGEQSLAIDLFGQQEQNVDSSGKGNFDVLKANLDTHAGGDADVLVHPANSTSVRGSDVVNLLGARVRIFSVDGGHTREIVQHDMLTAAESLAPGGVIVGDDVFNFAWPGVVEGTLSFLDENPDIAPICIGFNKVIFAGHAHALRYQDAIRAVARKRLWAQKESVFHGNDVVIVWKPGAQYRARLAAKRILRRF